MNLVWNDCLGLGGLSHTDCEKGGRGTIRVRGFGRFLILNIRTLWQAVDARPSPSNNPTGDYYEDEESNFEKRKDVIQEDAASSRNGVDKASHGSDGYGNAIDGALAERFHFLVRVRSLEDAHRAVDAIASHVAHANEADAEQHTHQDDCVFPISRPREDVLQIMELAAGTRD